MQDDGKRWSPFSRFELMSLDDERNLGMQFDDNLNEQVQLISDPIVTEFIQDLGLQIVSRVENNPFIYRFRVVESPQLNAFAVPGGYTYFYTGTLMAVTSVDELAEVMAHEITHVSKRHLAHRRKDRQLPTLLTNAALIAASVAVNDASPLIAGMAINVAVDLKYSRGDEAEADRVGAVYASRAGFDPSQGAHFFERILARRPLYADGVPPYLFSHPAVGNRIDELRELGKTLHPVGRPKPGTRKRFRNMQARLAELLARHRTTLPGHGAEENHEANDEPLKRVALEAEAGHNDRALQTLTQLAIDDPGDPRIPFQIGEILMTEERTSGAIAAYRHTTILDASRALVYFRLGEAYRLEGDRNRAVYAFERTLLLAKPGSPLAMRAHWEDLKLTYGVIAESEFVDPTSLSGNRTRVTHYPGDASALAWWARVSGPILKERPNLQIRWRDPSGRIVQEQKADEKGRLHVSAKLDFDALADAESPSRQPGLWTLEVLLENEVVHRDTIELGSED